MKYHNTPDGPRPCKATKRACPVGGEHFEDKAQAQEAYEASQSAVPAPVERTLPRTTVTSKVVPFAHGQYYGCNISKTHLNDHLHAMQEELGVGGFALYQGNKVQRDRGYHYHMTVVSPPELSKAKKEGRDFTDTPEANDITFEGLGRCKDGENEAYYIVCSSPSLDKWREDNGLEKKDFHITLGFSRKDVHTKGKGKDTIIRR